MQQTLGTPPYRRSVESARSVTVECIECDRGPTTLHLHPGRDWPWKHDHVTDHDVAYSDFEVKS